MSDSGTFMISFGEETTKEKFNEVIEDLKQKGATINQEVFSELMGKKLISATLSQTLLLSLQSNLKENDIVGIEPEQTITTQ
ncbi:hypothetical protein SCHPADRAFT_992769 [Schizopora paradoxa]|uniref:Inhibitor I9 domain-containing protein n=1 Tax=Schizopora paradoxa TaxID=27342 RepID=A0A0H2S5K4_9AGAM|nr:hypothetical protein SCHPADRAFT_992769 [Schizopora paradoxa]